MSERHVRLTAWERDFTWAPASPAAYRDPWVDDAPEVTYDARVWHSPVVESPFAANELVPSWNARTPPGTWLHVEGRVLGDLGWTPWLTFARWAQGDPAGTSPIVRTTVRGQAVEAGSVRVDTFVASEGQVFGGWQLRVTGLRSEGAQVWPEVDLVAAACSSLLGVADEPVSRPGLARGREIPVPPLSQRLHVGSFPQWDSGGESWCSPTSATMLLRYWGVAPSPEESAWVGHATDPDVVHAVRHVFDRDYGGAGNWAFNVAYVGSRGLRSYATRLRHLREAESFIAAGVPLVVSVSFTEHELDGAGYATDGHLLTVVGFTGEGDVISNDPNSHGLPSGEVRTVYRRDQFERAWLRSSGGLTYVMHPHEVPLPASPAEANWR